MSDRLTALVLSILMVASVATVGVAVPGDAVTVDSQDGAGSVGGSMDDPRDERRGSGDDGGDRGASRGGGSDGERAGNDGGDRDGTNRGDNGDERDQRNRSRDGGTSDDGTDDSSDEGTDTTDDESGDTGSVDESSGRTGIRTSVTLPPDPVRTFTQPDGTTFEAHFWSENLSVAWRTGNGYTVVQGADGYWHYATREDGRLVASGARVGIDPVPSSVSPGLEPASSTDSTTPTATSGTDGTAQTSDTTVTPDAAPSTGTANFPVVMINFNDTTTSYTESEFQSLLFGDEPAIATGPGSVTDYYEEASYGQLTVTGNVEGWVTADYNQSYYGEGGIGDGLTDFDAPELVKEAAQKADSQIDFSKYDNDNDGVVDQFVVIHQGAGQEVSGSSEDIWSHKFSINYNTNDGVKIDGYVIQPEELYESNDVMITIGVFAHEFGHAFGLPDLYDTDGTSQGIGRWGLMGSGSYGTVQKSGDAPNHMTAWSKEFMGWIDPPEVTLGEVKNGLQLRNVSQNNDYYKVLNETNNTNGEYFYVSNRQRVGFDQGLDGEGLVVTHIDRSKITAENCISNNDCNDDESDKLVDVEAADGDQDLDDNVNRGDSGDPWKGDDGSFDDTSTPSSDYDNGTASKVTVGPIQFASGNDDGTATVDISAGALLDWQWNASINARAQFATPAVGPDRVFAGGLGTDLTAFYRANGSVAWTFNRAGSLADSSPVLSSGTVYVGSGGGKIYSIDPDTGDELWNYTTDSAVVSSPTVSGGELYVGSNDGTLLAIETATTNVKWSTELGVAVLSKPAVGDGRVYVTLDNGTVIGVNQSNGNVEWKQSVAGGDLGHSSPTYVSGGSVIVAGDQVYRLDAATGGVTWATPISGTAGSSPAVASGTVYVGVTNGTVHALDAGDGSAVWKYDTGAVVASSPAVESGSVVVGNNAGTIYLFDASSGTVQQTRTLTGKVRSSPTIAGGTVYVGSDSGTYTALANI